MTKPALKEPTVQEAYEQIREFFSRPDAELGSEGEGRCFYRREGSDGKVLKCAVGCLVPDEYYSLIEDCEGHTVSTVWKKLGWSNGSLYSLLEEVQSAHDHAFDVVNFLVDLNKIAKVHGLKIG